MGIAVWYLDVWLSGRLLTSTLCVLAISYPGSYPESGSWASFFCFSSSFNSHSSLCIFLEFFWNCFSSSSFFPVLFLCFHFDGVSGWRGSMFSQCTMPFLIFFLIFRITVPLFSFDFILFFCSNNYLIKLIDKLLHNLDKDFYVLLYRAVGYPFVNLF